MEPVPKNRVGQGHHHEQDDGQEQQAERGLDDTGHELPHGDQETEGSLHQNEESATDTVEQMSQNGTRTQDRADSVPPSSQDGPDPKTERHRDRLGINRIVRDGDVVGSWCGGGHVSSVDVALWRSHTTWSVQRDTSTEEQPKAESDREATRCRDGDRC